MRTLMVAAAVASALTFVSGAAVAQDAPWSDPPALRALNRADDPMLAGMLAAWEMRDDEAASQLGRYLAAEPQSGPARRAARSTLAAVHLRNGAYAEAATLLEMGLPDFEPGSPERLGVEQTLAVARALAGAEPQRRGTLTQGRVVSTRDLAGLPRVPLTINGHPREYVFDTGANLSVVTETQAAELGLEMLGQTAGVGSITQDATPAHIGLARRLTIGNLDFENVVFLVMPDASLSFANGAYVIPGILGFPVISRLERVTVADGSVAWEPSAGPVTERDLYVDGLAPRVYGQIANGPPAPFALDTGANLTSLRPIALNARPDLAATAVSEIQSVGSAGGMREVEGHRLPSVELRFDAVSVTLTNIAVAGEKAGGDDIHGRLGQDILSRGYVMDFPAGDFALEVD